MSEKPVNITSQILLCFLPIFTFLVFIGPSLFSDGIDPYNVVFDDEFSDLMAIILVLVGFITAFGPLIAFNRVKKIHKGKTALLSIYIFFMFPVGISAFIGSVSLMHFFLGASASAGSIVSLYLVISYSRTWNSSCEKTM